MQPLDDLLHLPPEAAPVQEDEPHEAVIATQREARLRHAVCASKNAAFQAAGLTQRPRRTSDPRN